MPETPVPPARTTPEPAASGEAPRRDEALGLLLADCQRALEEEIEAVREDLARRGLEAPVPASGRAAGEAGTGFAYLFQLPRRRLDVRADDRVRVRAGPREAFAVVREYDRALSTLRVVAFDWLGERVPAAELEFDPTWLLRELALRLDEIAESPDAFHADTMLALLGRRFPSLGRREPGSESRELNGPQREALARILGSEAQLVWGPPGTGKTRLVAHAALELAAEGRVLVVAATNGAVDEVAGRILRRLGPRAVGANRLVRVGSELGGCAHPEISLDAALRRRIAAGAGGIVSRLAELEGRLGSRPDADAGPRARVARLLALARARDDGEAGRALGRLTREIGRQATALLEEADLVVTTLARLAVREELRGLRAESVVLDEASTAPIPHAVLAASLARRRAVAVGDFQQLPPVVVSRGPAAARWLRRDLFHESGVVEAGADGEVALPSPRDELCAMLTVQYRMAPPIRALVSELFYGGRLADAPGVVERPAVRTGLVLADTSGLEPAVERVEGSRRNAEHADLVVRILEVAARRGITDVGVVSPYRQQTRRIRELARGRLGAAAPSRLEVSTIHRFQGREKSFVLIDTVDAPPGRSWFLDERRNPDLPRLLAVAISRARDMLVVVGCVEGLRRTLPPGALLNRLVGRVASVGRVHDAGSPGLEELFG